jgi:hypothetical protein
MTNPTSNFGWQMPTSTDLVTDLPADFEVFGQAVDTDFVDLLGGTTGQVLSKTSATDLDFTWVTANPGDITGVTAGTGITGGGTSGTVTVTNDMATTITAAGDIVVGTGSGTYDNLPIGTTNQILTADTTVSPYKVKWATASGGGKVLQVVSATYSTQTTNTSTTFATTNLTATITPTLATSKIAVFATIDGCQNGAGIANMAIKFRLMRGGTQLSIFNEYSFTRSNLEFIGNYAHTFTDSPATTSATTYTMEFASAIATYTARVNTSSGSSNLILMEIGV